jgi:glycosyltransferase involved in cell wall biosynthesis
LSNKLHVAFFIPGLGDGGVTRGTLILAAEFVRHGHKVDVLTVAPRGEMIKSPPAGVRMVDLKSRRTITAVPKLARYLRRERPSALISAQHYANVASVWARMLGRTETKLILTERLSVAETLDRPFGIRNRIMPFLMRRFYSRADAVVANSKDGAAELATALGWSKDRVTPIYNPTIHDRLHKMAAEEVDHPYFAEGAPPVILSVARLEYPKDYTTLLEAFADVRKRTPARLLILGDGDLKNEIVSRARKLGVAEDVDLPGYADNPYSYMARAAVFVLSSTFEGLPNVVIEAQACNVPVVATDCPTGPREILLDGEAGRLVPVGDSTAMADAISGLILNQDEAKGITSIASQHLDRFLPDTCFDEYEKLIR